MGFREILRRLAVGREVDIEDLLRLRPDELQFLERLYRNGKLHVQDRKITINNGYRRRRKANITGVKRQRDEPADAGEAPLRPIGGLMRQKRLRRMVPGPPQRFRAFAVSESTTVSGSVHEQLRTDPRIREIYAGGDINEAHFEVRVWQGLKQIERCIIVTLDLARIDDLIFLHAYSGDAAGVRFRSLHLALPSTDTIWPMTVHPSAQLPFAQAGSLVANVSTEAWLHPVVPDALWLCGEFSMERVTGNIDLKSYPEFAMKLGHISLDHCFVAMTTVYEDDEGMVYATLNGCLRCFDQLLALSSALPIRGGIASFNLESRDCPKQKEFGALAPIVGDANVAGALGRLAALINDYRLLKLNVTFDIQTRALASISLTLQVGNSSIYYKDSAMRLNMVVNDIKLDIHISYSGSVSEVWVEGRGIGSIDAFDETAWEVAFVPAPEPRLQFWANALSVEQLSRWLNGHKAEMPPGPETSRPCAVSYYLVRNQDPVVMHVGADEGEDFIQVYPIQ